MILFSSHYRDLEAPKRLDSLPAKCDHFLHHDPDGNLILFLKNTFIFTYLFD